MLKKYTKKEIRKLELELFDRKTDRKRLEKIRNILRKYGWS